VGARPFLLASSQPGSSGTELGLVKMPIVLGKRGKRLGDRCGRLVAAKEGCAGTQVSRFRGWPV